jgi:hypothetical protein
MSEKRLIDITNGSEEDIAIYRAVMDAEDNTKTEVLQNDAPAKYLQGTVVITSTDVPNTSIHVEPVYEQNPGELCPRRIGENVYIETFGE